MWSKQLFRIGLTGGAAVSAYLVSQDNDRINRLRDRFVAATATTDIAKHPLYRDALQAGVRLLPDPSASAVWDSNWDLLVAARRDPKCLVKPKKMAEAEAKGPDAVKELLASYTPKASRHIILVRHGQYNLKGEKPEEKYLTELGRKQASETGKRLAYLDYKFDRVVHSTQIRAVETCNLILEHLDKNNVTKIVPDSMLVEGAPYPPEPPISHWKPDAREFMVDGARIEAAFRRYFHRAYPEQEADSIDLVVCHGNVSRALQLPPEAWLRLQKDHCSLTWLTVRPSGRVTLRTFGDTGHMPKDMITSS